MKIVLFVFFRNTFALLLMLAVAGCVTPTMSPVQDSQVVSDDRLRIPIVHKLPDSSPAYFLSNVSDHSKTVNQPYIEPIQFQSNLGQKSYVRLEIFEAWDIDCEPQSPGAPDESYITSFAALPVVNLNNRSSESVGISHSTPSIPIEFTDAPTIVNESTTPTSPISWLFGLDQPYTVQLLSMKQLTSIERYLDENNMNRKSTSIFPWVSAQGEQWHFATWGAFDSAADAESKLATQFPSINPDSIWIRNTEVLKQNLCRSKDFQPGNVRIELTNLCHSME